jgi:hypothetical protein
MSLVLLCLLLPQLAVSDSLSATPSPTDDTAKPLEFSQGQKVILYSTGGGALFIIIAGGILTIWCRKRNAPAGQVLITDDGDVPLPQTETYRAENL